MYRGALPHYRIDGTVYFVTWRLEKSQPDLAPAERSTVVDVLSFFDAIRYQLYAYVVMNDHVHVVVQPEHGMSLERIIHSWKSYSATKLQKEFGRKNKIWQKEYFDRILRNDRELEEKMQYIRNNPIKRWPDCVRYEWLSGNDFVIW